MGGVTENSDQNLISPYIIHNQANTGYDQLISQLKLSLYLIKFLLIELQEMYGDQ